MHCWHWQKSEKFQRPNSMVQTLGDDYDGKEGVGEGIVRVDDGKSWLMRPDNCIELVPFGRVVILKLSSTSYANCCTKYKHTGIQIQILQNTNINANTWFLLAELSSQASPGQPTATFCANCGTQYSRKLAFKGLLILPLQKSSSWKWWFPARRGAKTKDFPDRSFSHAKTSQTKRVKPFLTTSIKTCVCLSQSSGKIRTI